MNCEWDDKKASLNKRKHGVSFAEATTVFDDPNALEILDDSHSAYEERWILIGFSVKRRVLIVVYVEKFKDMIRIISARKAVKEEINQYKKRVEI